MDDKTLVTTAPPPPSEVKIRTMHSDLESMRKSGGGPAKFQSVRVPGLSLDNALNQSGSRAASRPAEATQVQDVIPASSVPERAAPAETPSANIPATPGLNNHLVPILIVALVAMLAVAGVGYFAYITFFK